MSDFITSWTKEEMRVYLLIFCANADFVELKGETDFIKARTKKAVYKKMHAEFDTDNDYESIQKIRTAFKKFNYSSNDTEMIFNEIKALFEADDDYSILEKNVYLGLKHILEE